MSFDNQSERMTSIAIDTDVESQTEHTSIEYPLRGILKNSSDNFVSEKKIKLRIVKICLVMVFIICYVPFIVADFHYGILNNNCVIETPNIININLKMYLLVSGFLMLFNLILTVLLILYLPHEATEEEYSLIIFGAALVGKISTLIHFIWNLLGIILFWAFIYEKEICDSEISTYLFVSLIVKTLANIGVTLYRHNRVL
jgi:hypothetical protein